MTMVLTELGEFPALAAQPEGERLWMSAQDMATATGWTLKPEGLCKGPLCVPVPAGRAGEFLREGRLDAAAFWRHLGNPVCQTARGDVWAFGEGGKSRAEALRSLQAPDFELPDRHGRPHRLSSYRGKKVFLVNWASW